MAINTLQRHPAKWLSVVSAFGCSAVLLFAPAHGADLPAQMQSAVDQGKEIFMHPSFGGNGKACNSCHHDGGTGPGALPDGTPLPSLSNAAAIFPRFNRKKKLVTIQDQIHNCVAGAIKGTPPAYDSDKMRYLVVYLTSLSQGKAVDMGGKPR
ncbi:MAG: cytochrome C [Gammaproteobacteria bacterium]